MGNHLTEGKTGLSTSFAFQREVKYEDACACYDNLTATAKEGKKIIWAR